MIRVADAHFRPGPAFVYYKMCLAPLLRAGEHAQNGQLVKPWSPMAVASLPNRAYGPVGEPGRLDKSPFMHAARMSATARISSLLTSRCVQARRRCGPDALIRTPLSSKAADKLRRQAQPRIDFEEDDVRLDVGRIDDDPVDVGNRFRKQPRVLVIVGQTLDIVLERIDGRGGENARPAGGAPPNSFRARRAGNECRRSHEDRSHRTAEPLRKANRNRVDVPGDRLGEYPWR